MGEGPIAKKVTRGNGVGVGFHRRRSEDEPAVLHCAPITIDRDRSNPGQCHSLSLLLGGDLRGSLGEGL